MAITNYGELKSAIADWLKRRSLTTVIPDLISLGEIRLRDGITVANAKGGHDTLKLRVREMQTLKTYSAGDSDTDAATSDDAITSITLPTNYLEASYIRHGKYSVERATPQAVLAARESNGRPHIFYREGEDIYFGPAPTSTDDVKLLYWADFTGALSADSDTNAILTAYPNLYLYSALMAAEPYLYNDPRLSTWLSELSSGIRSANGREMAESRSGGRKRMGVTF